MLKRVNSIKMALHSHFVSFFRAMKHRFR